MAASKECNNREHKDCRIYNVYDDELCSCECHETEPEEFPEEG